MPRKRGDGVELQLLHLNNCRSTRIKSGMTRRDDSNTRNIRKIEIVTNKTSLLALIVALAALLVALLHPAATQTAAPAKQESAFERVMRTRMIRCGYAIWNPVLFKDMQSGELRGVGHDIMDEIGKKLDLKIVWAEEAGWGNLIEGVTTNRYDMVCEPFAVVAARAKAVNFSTPVFYGPAYLVMRAGETRFKSVDDVNDPAVKIAVLDGEAFSFLAPKKFPKAQIDALPQNTDWSLIFQEVTTGKADVTGVSYPDFIEYDKANPGKMVILDKSHPTLVYAASYGLPQGDVAFKTMFDAALGELAAEGVTDRIISAYATATDEFLSPAKPYAPPSP